MSTGMTPPPGSGQVPAGEVQKKPLWKKKRFIIPAAIVAFFVIIGACTGGGDRQPTGSSTDPAPTSTAAATPTASEPPAATEPGGTPAQMQALAAAKGYLQTGIGFSQASLLKQLTSSFGNKFAEADAQWAVANSGADWNEQALKAAKGYLDSGIGFSQASLIRQLTAEAGSQFTQEQAGYAVANSGADWNEQAVKAAKGYMDTGIGFSRERLIDQLTSPHGSQFTQEQAEYAAGQVGL